MASPIWLTGFEYGLATLTTNGTGLFNTVNGSPTIQGTEKNTGAYALQINTTGATGYATKTIANAPQVLVGRFYIRFATFAAAETAIWRMDTGGGTVYYFSIVPGTPNRLRAYVDATSQDSTATISANTWYRVDFRVNANTGVFDWQIDGTAQTGIDASPAATTFSSARLGWGSSVTMNAFYDDVCLSVTSTDYPIGPGGTELIKPSGDGTHSAGTNDMEDQAGNDIGAVTAFDKINSVPIGNATTYIRQVQAITTDYVEVTFENISATHSAILGAQAVLAYTAATTTSCLAACIVSKDAFSTSTTVWGAPGSTADYSDGSTANLYYKSALISGVVDDTTVNALAARMGFSDDATPDPYWIDLLIEVAYSVNDGPTGTAEITESADTISAGGALAVSASSTTSESTDTTTAAGQVAISASGAITEVSDTISGAGSLLASGSASNTESTDAIMASAATLATGSATNTETADTLSASGTTTISASASLLESADTLTTAGAVSVAGTADNTEAADTLTGAAALAVAGSADIAESADTLDASGTVSVTSISGDADIIEDIDTLSAFGTMAVAGSAGITEDNDTLTSAGTALVYCAADITEDVDALSASGFASIAASGAITESEDTLSASGTVSIAGSADIAESADTLTATGFIGDVPVMGAASIAEDADTPNTSGSVSIAGAFDVTENADTVTSTGTALVSGSTSLAETADALAAAGYVAVSAGASIAEIADAILASVRTVSYEPTASIIHVEREAIATKVNDGIQTTRGAIGAGRKDAGAKRNNINARTGD